MKKPIEQQTTRRLLDSWCEYANLMGPIASELKRRPYTERYQYLVPVAQSNTELAELYCATLLAPNTNMKDWFGGKERVVPNTLKILFSLWLNLESVEAEKGLGTNDTNLLQRTIDTISTKPLEERVMFCERLGDEYQPKFTQYFLK